MQTGIRHPGAVRLFPAIGRLRAFGVNDVGHRILVVEDDPALREVYAGSLQELGHVVRTAGDGGAALNQLTNDWTPCVIFLDLRMPGMDGWEFAHRLHADDRLKTVPIVVVAAHFRIDQEAREIGAAAWLQKPFDLQRLDDQIKTHCREGMARANG